MKGSSWMKQIYNFQAKIYFAKQNFSHVPDYRKSPSSVDVLIKWKGSHRKGQKYQSFRSRRADYVTGK